MIKYECTHFMSSMYSSPRRQLVVVMALALILASCDSQQESAHPMGSTAQQRKEAPSKCFISNPDTSVAGIRLRDRGSFVAVTKSNEKSNGEDRISQFYSHNRREQILFSMHSDDKENTVSEVVVQKADKYAKESRRILSMNEFVTEKGIRLGMSKKDLIAKLGTVISKGPNRMDTG